MVSCVFMADIGDRSFENGVQKQTEKHHESYLERLSEDDLA